MRSPEALQIIEDPAHAAIALSPIRRRALAALAESEDSATGLAERLGTTRQRLNYHLRELERAGLVELVAERRKGNCLERVLRAKARHWLIDPGALADLASEPMPPADRFSAAYLVALAARAIREVAGLTGKAARSRKRLATLAIDADVRLAKPADFPAFADDLARAVRDVIARHGHEAPGGRRFRVMAAAWPGKSTEPDTAAEKKEER